MFLPEKPAFCLSLLEQAGFCAYVVGGCVRDALLGLCPQDYDICTSATPEQTSAVFSDYPQIHNGEKHGTVGVILDGEVFEITTFRKEGPYQDSRHPDWVSFVSRIEEDLARRDFTVNAMAFSPTRGYADPFGGREDLKNRILRTVGDPRDRFSEDALRILRGVRFAVRYDLTPTAETLQQMSLLAPTLNHLAQERVFSELCKLLPLVNTAHLLQYVPVLACAIPELKPMVGMQQNSPHHAYDVFTHTAHVVASMPPDLALRWAALLHDTGKPACYAPDENGRGHFPGHGERSAQLANDVLLRLKAPTALREEVVFLVGHHMMPTEPDKHLLRRRLGKYGVPLFSKLLTLQQGDNAGKGIPEEQNEALLCSLMG